MAEGPRLLDALRAADRSLRRERLPPAGVQRIARRIARELDRRDRQARWPWVPMMTFVAGAAVVLAFLAWARAPRVDVSPTATPRHALIAAPDCSTVGANGAVAVDGACQVISREPGMRVQTMADAKLDVEHKTIRLRKGTALFDVDPVDGDPVRVQTPAGVVIVVGTRFTVDVSDGTTHVDLFEGKVEFHGNDGNVTPIEAGQQWAFGETQGGGELLDDIDIEVIDDAELSDTFAEAGDAATRDAAGGAEDGAFAGLGRDGVAMGAGPGRGRGGVEARRDGDGATTAPGGGMTGDGMRSRAGHDGGAARSGVGRDRDGSDGRAAADGRRSGARPGGGAAADGRQPGQSGTRADGEDARAEGGQTPGQGGAPPPHDDEASKAEPRPSAADIIERVNTLRRSGNYKQAVRELEAALRRPWPRRTAEVLSYELGRILARHLRNGARACKHWRTHLTKFPQTRYRDQITASRTKLRCGE